MNQQQDLTEELYAVNAVKVNGMIEMCQIPKIAVAIIFTQADKGEWGHKKWVTKKHICTPAFHQDTLGKEDKPAEAVWHSG